MISLLSVQQSAASKLEGCGDWISMVAVVPASTSTAVFPPVIRMLSLPLITSPFSPQLVSM
jgi:hypothetical protein